MKIRKRILQKTLVVFLSVAAVALSAAVTVPHQGTQAQAADEKAAALKAYKEELSKTESSIGFGQAQSFFIKDVDGDKIPEMIMYFSASSQICLCKYQYNKVKCLVEGKYGMDIYPSKHVVKWTYETGSFPCDHWYKISNGKAREVAYRRWERDWENGTDKNQFYKVNGKETTKKKYDRYLKKIRVKKRKYKMVENTEKNRSKYLDN